MELNRLEEEGALEHAAFSEWDAPIVGILKSNKKTIRICGDFH